MSGERVSTRVFLWALALRKGLKEGKVRVDITVGLELV